MPGASIEGSLKERGVRLTRQRQILLELIDKTGEHLDAESLFQMAKEKDPKLNRVTVYRTLKMLKAGGLVDELDLMHYGGDQHYYETRLKQEHAHVICLRCGKVRNFSGNRCSGCANRSRRTSAFRSCWRGRKWVAIVRIANPCAPRNWKGPRQFLRRDPRRGHEFARGRHV
jgi:Fe2+ or Zn2+ uptake regulation protein